MVLEGINQKIKRLQMHAFKLKRKFNQRRILYLKKNDMLGYMEHPKKL